MLLRFGVKNHLSLRDEQSVTMTASSLKDDEDSLIRPAQFAQERVLPSVVIYGPNASGKSNLLAALRTMKLHVLHSHRHGDPTGGVPRSPFLLDKESEALPSRFEVDFIFEETRYHFGFEADGQSFTREWLYSFSGSRPTRLFERNRQEFQFGRSLKGKNSVIADLTRPNSLFVSAAAQNDHDELSKVSNFFSSIQIFSSSSVPGEAVSMSLANRDIDRRALSFLDRIGTGVVTYRQQETDLILEHKALRDGIDALVRQIFKQTGPSITEGVLGSMGSKKTSIELGHKGRGNDPVFLDLERESAGTRRLLVLLGPIFAALDTGSSVAVDELDMSLHTKATEVILQLFARKDTNPYGAQLLATVHDTNLLRSPVLRRDQIWFSEKDDGGATHLYPLSDIRTRKGDDIEKGYLQGRFGAIPYSSSLEDLFGQI